MQRYSSRFGIVSAGKIESFSQGSSLTVDGAVIRPSPSFWARFNPQTRIVTPAPSAKQPAKQKADKVSYKKDFAVGYYVLLDGGHDRFVNEDEFSSFSPAPAE